MSKTLADYITIVQREIDSTATTDRQVTADDITRKYQEVLLQAHKYLTASTVENITTVAETANYNPTTGFTELYKVLYQPLSGSPLAATSDPSRLTPITEQEYLDVYLNEDPSTPVRYYVKGETIYLSPAPDGTGTLKVVYMPIPTELENDTDISIIPDRYTNVIKYGAVADFLAFEKDPASDKYRVYYLNALEDMIKELKTNYESIRPRFRGRARSRVYGNYSIN